MMKKIISSLIAVAALGASFAFAANNTPGTGVINTSHDMRLISGVVDPQNRVCAFCHTPHHAFQAGDVQNGGTIPTDVVYLPLWSHAITADMTYQIYGTGIVTPFNNLGGNSPAPGGDPLYGDSRLCMSCHDGVTAMNAYYQAAIDGPASPKFMPNPGTQFNNKVIEHDLNRTHPIGFNMLDVVPGQGGTYSDPGIKTLTSSSMYVGNTNANVTIFNRLAGYVDGGNVGILTCSTCHDVHNTLNKGINTSGGSGYFLLGSQDGSGICLSCHTQGTGL